ncbi:transmembrane channel-like protein 3 [Nasonia vitripennis]|uniref:TMC domain-containing protein n=1 Tax=Nasonia vitripennis TaxID=7425 RepID=A0A7M7PYU9_NASVI|nr:transmembrane channel-like protein 3 [Nasonia vitripennis]
MLKLNSASCDNDSSPEEVIQLSETTSTTCSNAHRSEWNTSDDSLLNVKTDKQDDNDKYQHSLHIREKGTESEDSENSETVNLIYPYTTLRMARSTAEAMEEQAETIANHIQRKNKQDDPLSELAKLEMIRDMSQCLTLKRSVKAKIISESLKSKRRPIGYWKNLRYKMSMTISKMKIAFRQFGSSIELWYHPIKTIEGHFGSGIATYFKFLRWLFIMNTVGCVFSICFVTLPQVLVQSHQIETFSSWDLLLGNGLFTNSIFYYGFYTNDTLMLDSEVAYDMPSAYFLTFVFCYTFTFILLCFKVARSYKKCYIETSSGANNRYANKIFCSWDWGISSQKAASLRSASIYRELEELLWDSKNLVTTSSCCTRIWTHLIRITMTTLILAVMCGTGVLLWLLLNEHEADETKVVSVLTVPVVITAIVTFIPPLMSWSVKYEKYAKDRVAFYITMIRVYIIAVIAVATLLTFWLTRGIQAGCWQTRLAQEIYRLVLLDLFVSVFGMFLVQVIRASKPLRERFGAPTFDIARNTLNLIYNQSLFWLVHYFSPPISLVILVKLLITFYVKKCELLYFCEPPSKFWRAAQTQTLFLALTFLGMISAITVLSYVLIYVDTSSCGPFAGTEYTWQHVVEQVLQLRRDSTFWIVLGEIANPGTGIALLITMCVAVYYLRAKAEASKQMVRILREMLVWQARDKEFLVKTFSTATSNSPLRHRQLPKSLNASSANNEATSEPALVNEPSTSY